MVERATGGRTLGAGRLAGCHDTSTSPAGVGLGNGREQRLGVGVRWSIEQLIDWSNFHDPPKIHHSYPVGDRIDDTQVMRDEQVGKAEAILQILQQVQDLRPDRHVERRDRLVEHDEAGLEGDGAGDPDPLPLAAGELVRIARGGSRFQAHRAQQRVDPRSALGPRAHAVHDERLQQAAANGEPWVQRGHRILEDELHVAPQATQRVAPERQHVLTGEADAPVARLDQPQHRSGRAGFAATRLANDRQRLATA